jgi:hypothetical protein
LGILHQKDYYGLNNRSELMIYDADIGWATVIPSGKGRYLPRNGTLGPRT